MINSILASILMQKIINVFSNFNVKLQVQAQNVVDDNICTLSNSNVIRQPLEKSIRSFHYQHISKKLKASCLDDKTI